jgi:hypothetical protein
MNAPSFCTRGSLVALTLVTLGATACGSSSAKSTSTGRAVTSTVAAGSESGGATTTTAAGGKKTGHVGDTLTNPDQYVPADVATVRLVKVVDPATPVDAGTIADPGKRWVGLDMTIVDNGDNARVATDEAFATGTDGKVYAIDADITDGFTECTSTMTDLQPNQKATFCPGFLLPNGVTITKVGYSTRTSDSSQAPEITWTVP